MMQRIVALDIKRKHPVRLNCDTDLEYAGFANKVRERLTTALLPHTDEEVVTEVALNLTLYLEDVIADCGIWRTFVTKHKELYKKSLPFYPVEESSYYADEPCVEDVQFVIWQTLYSTFGILLNPEECYLMDAASAAMEVIEEGFETLSINTTLADYFHKAGFLADFIPTRFLLRWLMFDCYLTGTPQLYPILEENANELMSVLENGSMAAYQTDCLAGFTYKVGPMAYFPTEWLRFILAGNGNKEAAQIISDMVFYDYSAYQVMKEDDKGVYLESVQGEEIFITYTVLNLKKGVLVKGKQALMSLVRFKDKWELNGMLSEATGSDLFERYRKEEEEKKKITKGIPRYKALMELSGGSPFFYFKDSKEYKTFLKKEMKLKDAKLIDRSFPNEEQNIVLFMPSAKEGFDTVSELACFLQDERNPYYEEDLDSKSIWEAFINLTTPGMIDYIIRQNMLPNLSFPIVNGEEERARSLVSENIDFLARCLKRMNY